MEFKFLISHCRLWMRARRWRRWLSISYRRQVANLGLWVLFGFNLSVIEPLDSSLLASVNISTMACRLRILTGLIGEVKQGEYDVWSHQLVLNVSNPSLELTIIQALHLPRNLSCFFNLSIATRFSHESFTKISSLR